ncbi:MAG: ParB/RepB/Spo0J family partition protein [Bacteroidales bacterium]|nr:ParB/RepB/Spo0J family partition protein [Bacteroidales bacterium]
MAVKKPALGKGLGALIDDTNFPSVRTSSINEIEIEQIIVNPFQPREKFDEEGLQELAASIKELGIIQPVTVRKTKDGNYQLIAGERRYRASKIAGLKKIPAYIRTANDQGMLEMSLVENIQREDLDSIEVAISYQRLIDECDLTQENLSNRVSKKRSTITNYLRLLKLPAEIQLGIRNADIFMGHARAIVSIDDPKIQLSIYKQIIAKDLSVRKVEELAKIVNNPPEITEKKPTKLNISKEYQQLKEHLSNYFNCKIDLSVSDKGKGKIIIPFSSNEDLERIIGIMDKLGN